MYLASEIEQKNKKLAGYLSCTYPKLIRKWYGYRCVLEKDLKKIKINTENLYKIQKNDIPLFELSLRLGLNRDCLKQRKKDIGIHIKKIGSIIIADGRILKKYPNGLWGKTYINKNEKYETIKIGDYEYYVL